jgi:hypothetical protein
VNRETGSAMFEMVVIGFAVVLMVLPVILTVAKLTEANALVSGAARDSAVWVARHGGEPPEVEGVDVVVTDRGDAVEVSAAREVQLVGVGGAGVSTTVRSRVVVSVSRYRSTP